MVDHQSHSVFNHDKLRLKLFVYINIYLLIVCHKRPDAFRYESKMPHSATMSQRHVGILFYQKCHIYIWPIYMGQCSEANLGTILKESLRIWSYESPIKCVTHKFSDYLKKKHKNFKLINFGALNSKLNWFLYQYN